MRRTREEAHTEPKNAEEAQKTGKAKVGKVTSILQGRKKKTKDDKIANK